MVAQQVVDLVPQDVVIQWIVTEDERLDNLLDDGRDVLDLEARLDTLQARAERAIDHLLTLTVLFFVQTLLVPIAAFWLSLAVFRGLWRWLQPLDRSGH